jgi:hypothetical protein
VQAGGGKVGVSHKFKRRCEVGCRGRMWWQNLGPHWRYATPPALVGGCISREAAATGSRASLEVRGVGGGRLYKQVGMAPGQVGGSARATGLVGGGLGHKRLPRGSWRCYNTVRTPTLCKPDTSDRPYLFSFNLLNLATPLLSYAVRLVLLILVPLSSLPCYLYDAALILTLDILYSLIDTFLSILRYISTHVFVVEP